MSEKLTIEEMQRIAKERGGKCLSETYVNQQTELLWECAKGHQWEATPKCIKRGHWCHYCGGSTKLTIEEMQRIAEERGGKCLSETYVNQKTKLLWECAEGHQWEATPDSIKRGRWCRKCAGLEKGTIEEMQRIAVGRGGKCLSNIYTDSSTKLLWECAKGHQWEATPGSVKSGSWCQQCSYEKCGEALRLTIAEMQQIATERGGKCLSETYVNSQTKLLWQCAEGHQWSATPGNIKNGSWCSECSTGLGERICREFFEQLFGKNFPKSYPRWLANQNGNRMELDGYCKSLKLAFEHQGDYHYRLVPPYTPTEEKLRERQGMDKIKRELCTQRGIVLIEVPEIPFRLQVKKVKAFIKEQCEQKGVPLPLSFDTKKVDPKNAYRTSGSRKAIEELHAIAKKRGGKCLSENYVNRDTKLLWECVEGHQWEAAPDSVKHGSWCQQCAGKAKGTIEEMQQIAAERGGKCLSETYLDNKTKLLWECAEDHQWQAKPNDIKNGHWCPYCTGLAKGTIEEMQRIAEERGGKCLSNIYTNSSTKLLWECAKGHQWEATPGSVKHRSWCQKCAGKAKGTIEEMQQIAAERDGKCLSESYVNNRTKLLWQCVEGHQWEATPGMIKSGTWCPKCAKSRRVKK